MSRAARDFDLYWLALALGMAAGLIWLTWIHPSPVSSPGGGGGVPAVTETAGASTP